MRRVLYPWNDVNRIALANGYIAIRSSSWKTSEDEWRSDPERDAKRRKLWLWRVYEMASFGRGLGILLPFLGCQRTRLLAHTGESPAGRAWRAHIVILFGLFSTTEEKEIDHGAKTNLTSLLSTATLCSNRLRDGRRSWWIMVTMCCTQCPASKITLCLIPSFVWIWLAVIFLVSGEILTERRYPSWPSRAVNRSWCQKEALPHCFIDYDTELKSTRPTYSQRTHHLCRCRAILLREFPLVFPLFQPGVVGAEASESMTLLPRTSCSVTFTSAWICAPMSCCHWQHHFPDILVHDKRIDGVASIRNEIMVVLHQRDCTRCGLKVFLVFPQLFSMCWPRRAGSMNLAPSSSTRSGFVPFVFLIVHRERSSLCDSSHSTILTCISPYNSSQKKKYRAESTN